MGKDDPYLRSRGIRMPKHPRFTTGMIRRALREGTYETRECEAVLRVTRPGDRVLEFGGGLGYVSTLVAVRRAPSRIVTVEANPDLIPYIRSVHEANGVSCATLHHGVVAAESGGDRPFHVRHNLLGSSAESDTDPASITACHAVPRLGAAELVAQERPDILVCDIEGAEAEALSAADWSGLRAAVIELHPQWIGPAGVRAVFDAMHRGGLTFFPKASHGKVTTFLRDW